MGESIAQHGVSGSQKPSKQAAENYGRGGHGDKPKAFGNKAKKSTGRFSEGVNQDGQKPNPSPRRFAESPGGFRGASPRGREIRIKGSSQQKQEQGEKN